MATSEECDDPDDWVGSCQQCGRPIYASETLCRACRWGVALADAEAQADDGQDATTPEGAALADEELPALRARCAALARLVDALRRQLAGGAYGN